MHVQDAKAAISKALAIVRSLQVLEGSDRDFVEEQLALALELLSKSSTSGTKRQ